MTLIIMKIRFWQDICNVFVTMILHWHMWTDVEHICITIKIIYVFLFGLGGMDSNFWCLHMNITMLLYWFGNYMILSEIRLIHFAKHFISIKICFSGELIAYVIILGPLCCQHGIAIWFWFKSIIVIALYFILTCVEYVSSFSLHFCVCCPIWMLIKIHTYKSNQYSMTSLNVSVLSGIMNPPGQLLAHFIPNYTTYFLSLTLA